MRITEGKPLRYPQKVLDKLLKCWYINKAKNKVGTASPPLTEPQQARFGQ